MTPLHQWVVAHNQGFAAIAAALGIHRVTLHRYCSGACMPGPRAVAAIEAYTRGEVTGSVLVATYQARRAEAAV